MSKFYTNVYRRFNKIYLIGYENKRRVEKVIKYQPYLFYPNKEGDYKSIDGISCSKIDFPTIKEASQFLEKYGDIDNAKVYGLTQWQYLYIYDNYLGEIDYDPKVVSVVSIDIECAADEGFPDIRKADKEITAITLRKNGHSYVLGCGDFETTDKNVTYIKCENEKFLLGNFIKTWRALKPDIITGWNIEFFDIPYTINRIRVVLQDDYELMLSPWGFIDEREVEFKGKVNQSFVIAGISALDYYQLYRKFTFGNSESYKLDYIAYVELGEKKIDYSEYGSLLSLYKNNYQKFIEYNIHDAVLVDRLEDKLKFIELVMALAYDAKVNFSDTMTTVRPWDIIIHNYLLERGIVVPPMKENYMPESLMGGYVKEPKLGWSKWVVSFDLNSLYPHLIMMYNISPETFKFQFDGFPSIDSLLLNSKTHKTCVSMEDYVKFAFAANGCAYSKEKQGFLPALMEKMYNDRSVYKKKMIETKKIFEKTKDPEDEKLIARYHNFQMAKKIQLNSAYGALANQYFRWFNFKHAEAITSSGQLSIRWIEERMNMFLNKMLKTDNKDYVVAADTDSIYVCLDEVVNAVYGDEHPDDLEIVKLLDEFCEKKMQPYINKCYEDLYVYMNAYQQKMFMKRETIANKGIWTAKKKYVLNAWNVEGVQYDKPKLKIQGNEAVRSSTPQICREKIKEALSIIMNKNEAELHLFIANFKKEFYTLPFEQVAFPRGVNNMKEYADKKTIYRKSTPIHVKGSLIFNRLLEEYKITTIPPIQDGDKIKYAYLKTPNTINERCIASPDELPKEFNLDRFIDYDTQFEKTFLDPIRIITKVIDWDTEKRVTLEDFFE